MCQEECNQSAEPEYEGEWYEQPECDYMEMMYGRCQNAAWHWGAMQKMDLFHRITYTEQTKGGQQKFEVVLEPSIDMTSSSGECTGSIATFEETFEMNMDMRCDNVAGSMYDEKVLADSRVRPLAKASDDDTRFCTGNVDVTEDGTKDYTLKIGKAGFDVTGDGGGFEFDATGTALGEPIELQALLGWNALYSIEQGRGWRRKSRRAAEDAATESAGPEGAVGGRRGRSLLFMDMGDMNTAICIQECMYGGGRRQRRAAHAADWMGYDSGEAGGYNDELHSMCEQECNQSAGEDVEWYAQPECDWYSMWYSMCVPAWDWGDIAGIDLHQKIKYAEQNGPAFEFSLDPVIVIDSDQITGSVPARLQVDGEDYRIEATMACSSDDLELVCSELAVEFKQNDKLRANVVLDTAAITIDEKGGVDIKGTALADSRDNMYALTEYSISTDIHWLVVDTFCSFYGSLMNLCEDGDEEFSFTLKRMFAEIKQVGASAGKARRGEAGDIVFGMEGQCYLDLSGDFLGTIRGMEMSMKMEMGTSENDQALISFGDLNSGEKKLSVLDSAPWFPVVDDVLDGVSKFISSSQEAVAAGQGFLQVTDWAKIKSGDTMVIGEGANQETVLVVSVSATGLVVLASALQNTHEAGAAITFEARESAAAPGIQSGAMSTVPLQLQVLMCISLLHSLLL